MSATDTRRRDVTVSFYTVQCGCGFLLEPDADEVYICLNPECPDRNAAFTIEVRAVPWEACLP